METNRQNISESNDKYVRLKGPALIGRNTDEKYTLQYLDVGESGSMPQPKGNAFVFANPGIMLERVELIIELSQADFDRYQPEIELFEGERAQETPSTEPLMNPSHPRPIDGIYVLLKSPGLIESDEEGRLTLQYLNFNNTGNEPEPEGNAFVFDNPTIIVELAELIIELNQTDFEFFQPEIALFQGIVIPDDRFTERRMNPSHPRVPPNPNLLVNDPPHAS